LTGNSLLGGDSIHSPNGQIEDEDDDEDENEKSSRNSSTREGSSTKTEGFWHNPDLPESKEANKFIAEFFAQHLGR
jgi:hypothetical protein